MTNIAVALILTVLPMREVQILRMVADDYALSPHQTKLLLVIRKIENGGPGLEMGVGDGIPNHPARRFADDFEKSLYLQGMWTAGTIKHRYKGDLAAFAQRYCPLKERLEDGTIIEFWKCWHKNAKWYMKR